MLLELSDINKQFNGVYALKNIDFEISAGEIHGLVGENGAGKSTLIKILTGVYELDSGQVFWNDAPVHIKNPWQSREIGINVIHQDRNLVPAFNGVENAYLGLRPETKLAGLMIDWQKMKNTVTQIANSLGIELDFNQSASALSPTQRTLLEIVRAMMTDCQLLILDEPTASLTDKESELLFNIIDRLKRNGTSILYVTHRMEEIFKLTDRVTVLKNGQFVDTFQTKNITKEQIISAMTDNWVSEKVGSAGKFGKTILAVNQLSSKDKIVKNVNFSLRSGEIVGIFGLGGSGRTETLECIYGLRQIAGGEIKIHQKPYPTPTPESSLANGVVLICEDRRGMGIITNLNVKQNIVLSTMEQYAHLGVVDERRETQDALQKISELSIRTTGPSQPVAQLSGGNQQKVVFAKAMMSKPSILLCDEPTQAVDVKTRAEIHRLVRELANQGAGVVFVSSDLVEILNISDTILVISNGVTKECIENDGIPAEYVLSRCYQEQ